MAKRTKKSTTGKWTDSLDPEAIGEALEEATVDAHGESEQHTGLLTAIQDEVEFPFPALALGEKVQIVDMEWPDDEVGLDFVCEHKGKRHRIDASSVELADPLPKGHLYIAAYLDWRRRL
jgi:hypothetical protein